MLNTYFKVMDYTLVVEKFVMNAEVLDIRTKEFILKLS